MRAQQLVKPPRGQHWAHHAPKLKGVIHAMRIPAKPGNSKARANGPKAEKLLVTNASAITSTPARKAPIATRSAMSADSR
jgi:hypothetical protein